MFSRFNMLSSHLKTTHSFSSMQKEKLVIVFFGAPGVGKGTYAKLLCKDFNLIQLSLGDEIRKIVKGQETMDLQPNLIQQIKSTMNEGKLISDDIVMRIVEAKMNELGNSEGVILDGFPRTKAQLTKFKQLFPIHLVINFHLRNDILIEKLLGRRVCSNCGTSFNVCSISKDQYEMPAMLPKSEGRCDECGGQLIQRDDDNLTTIKKRMQEYEEKTYPILEEYHKMGICMDIEMKRGVTDYPLLLEQIKTRLSKGASNIERPVQQTNIL